MKDTLRNEMRAMRRTLTAAQIANASDTITQKVLATDAFKNAKTVCLYLSAYREVDTAALLNTCRQAGKSVCLPVTSEDGRITLYADNGVYKQGNFGIKEPAGNEVVSPQVVDLFIVPALAYDKSGNRLGFGKGCYDRLMENTNGFKIGICYDFQVVDVLPTDTHDIQMDMIIYA